MRRTISKGQLSLEYLLLLLAVLSVFAVLLPLLNTVFELSLFGLDSVNGKRFSFQMQESLAKMSFQADGSITSIEANPFGKWRIHSKGEELFVAVKGPGEREKLFTILFPNSLQMQETIVEGKTSFLLKKLGGKILLEHN